MNQRNTDGQADGRRKREAEYDKTLADSFPASDPPATSLFTSTRTTGNEPAEGIDPGGTRPGPQAPTVVNKVSTGDRNDLAVPENQSTDDRSGRKGQPAGR